MTKGQRPWAWVGLGLIAMEVGLIVAARAHSGWEALGYVAMAVLGFFALLLYWGVVLLFSRALWLRIAGGVMVALFAATVVAQYLSAHQAL